MPIVWLLLSGLITLLGVTAVALAGMDSESGGMSMAYAAAGPLGFAWGGGLAALIAHFAIKAGLGRVFVPIGCGCVGAIGMAVTTFLFFAVIFPAL